MPPGNSFLWWRLYCCCIGQEPHKFLFKIGRSSSRSFDTTTEQSSNAFMISLLILRRHWIVNKWFWLSVVVSWRSVSWKDSHPSFVCSQFECWHRIQLASRRFKNCLNRSKNSSLTENGTLSASHSNNYSNEHPIGLFHLEERANPEVFGYTCVALCF